jgi:hypothetical protein
MVIIYCILVGHQIENFHILNITPCGFFSGNSSLDVSIDEIIDYPKDIRKFKPSCYIDFVMIHKGNPVYGFQISGNTGLTEKKIEIIKELSSGSIFEMYEIKADWILKQDNKPDKLKVKRIN